MTRSMAPGAVGGPGTFPSSSVGGRGINLRETVRRGVEDMRASHWIASDIVLARHSLCRLNNVLGSEVPSVPRFDIRKLPLEDGSLTTE
jgi:hypothetical protein